MEKSKLQGSRGKKQVVGVKRKCVGSPSSHPPGQKPDKLVEVDVAIAILVIKFYETVPLKRTPLFNRSQSSGGLPFLLNYNWICLGFRNIFLVGF